METNTLTIQQPEKRRGTRAEAFRNRVKIRLATNEMGPHIRDVLAENGIELPEAKWDAVFPTWLIATVEDEVIGCCQVLLAKPVGFVEFLFVRPSVGFKLRAIAVRKLIIQGLATLYHGGCQYCGGVVSRNNEKFHGVLEKLNFVQAGNATVMLKRLTSE